MPRTQDNSMIAKVLKMYQPYQFTKNQFLNLFQGKELTVIYIPEAPKTGENFVNTYRKKGIFNEVLIPPFAFLYGRKIINKDYIEEFRKTNPNIKIVKTLKELVELKCSLILTTGGTGPAKRDVTPEATKEVIEKELPGFGELMRMHSLQYVPTAILSRSIAGVIENSFILNLPGSPKAIRENLEAVWSAIPYTVDLIEGEYIESPNAFRPKKSK